jgi:hypothetical protein
MANLARRNYTRESTARKRDFFPKREHRLVCPAKVRYRLNAAAKVSLRARKALEASSLMMRDLGTSAISITSKYTLR